MSSKEITLIIAFIVLLLLIIVVKEIYTIHSIKVKSDKEYLFPDGSSIATIYIEGVNRFGFRIPFRTIETEFEIIEGNSIVSLISSDSSCLILKSKYEVGNVVILIKNKFTILPIKFEIPIIKPQT